VYAFEAASAACNAGAETTEYQHAAREMPEQFSVGRIRPKYNGAACRRHEKRLSGRHVASELLMQSSSVTGAAV
jgi:hypothetical protein